jgi:hypothetical protein
MDAVLWREGPSRSIAKAKTALLPVQSLALHLAARMPRTSCAHPHHHKERAHQLSNLLHPRHGRSCIPTWLSMSSGCQIRRRWAGQRRAERRRFGNQEQGGEGGAGTGNNSDRREEGRNRWRRGESFARLVAGATGGRRRAAGRAAGGALAEGGEEREAKDRKAEAVLVREDSGAPDLLLNG